MSTAEAWRQSAEGLRAVLAEKGVLGNEELTAAFWEVPRHRFVDTIYVHNPIDYSWMPEPKPADAELDREWLDRIYCDGILVTSLDDMGHPGSSNSVPSLVFRLLSLVGVRPGARVLEIGTGSGQLTALLATLVGKEGTVLSVELDQALVEAARSRFAEWYPEAPVEFCHADAAALDHAGREFDLIISTASCWPIPENWLTALAPDGQVCVELRGGLAGGMVLARAASTSTAGFGEACEPNIKQFPIVSGDFLLGTGAFMPLRTPAGPVPLEFPFGFGEYETKRAEANGLTVNDVFGYPFNWYSQLELPDARLVHYAANRDLPPAPYLIADGGLDGVRLPGPDPGDEGVLVSYGDSASLLERLVGAWDDWQRRGRPGLAEFTYTTDATGAQYIALRQNEKTWKIGDAAHADSG
jgi:protein-L-isoaspartate O-methyltransferase